MSDENGSNKSKYKQRKLMRLRGHAPMPRDPPHYYAEFMADFALREREQGEAARKGPLSTDPQRPWGNKRLTREQLAEMEDAKLNLLSEAEIAANAERAKAA